MIQEPLEVTLRSSLRFFFLNQTQVTAEDVRGPKYEFFQKDPDDPTPLKSAFSSLKKVEVLSPGKLRFHLSEANGEFIYNLSIGLLTKEQAEGPRINDPKKVIGCGQFDVDQWSVSHSAARRTVIPLRMFNLFELKSSKMKISAFEVEELRVGPGSKFIESRSAVKTSED